MRWFYCLNIQQCWHCIVLVKEVWLIYTIALFKRWVIFSSSSRELSGVWSWNLWLVECFSYSWLVLQGLRSLNEIFNRLKTSYNPSLFLRFLACSVSRERNLCFSLGQPIACFIVSSNILQHILQPWLLLPLTSCHNRFLHQA
jgi:hypothetical protein